MPYNFGLLLASNIVCGQNCIPTCLMKSLLFRKRKPANTVILEPKPMPSLAVCILMDVIGYASFAIPVLGEVIDLVWAPISALIYMKLFGFKKGFLGGVFNFVEELMPGMDIIPTFTITWFMQYAKRRNTAYSLRPFTK